MAQILITRVRSHVLQRSLKSASDQILQGRAYKKQPTYDRAINANHTLCVTIATRNGLQNTRRQLVPFFSDNLPFEYFDNKIVNLD